MRIFSWLFIIVLIIFSSEQAFSQMNRKNIRKNNRRISSFRGKKYHFGKEKRYNTIGVSLNALNYYGDLAPRPNKISTDISFTRPSIGLSFSHRFGPRYTVSATFMYGTLRGSDAESADKSDASNGIFRYQRNLSFRNRIKELTVLATFDLFENQATYISRVRWTPYVSLGVTLFHHNPQGKVPATDLKGNPLPNAGKWINLRELGTEGQYSQLAETDINYGAKPYNLFQAAIPLAIGVRFRVNEVMDIAGEFGFRYTFTDYLDDVSKNYVDLGVFGDNELAKAMSYRSSEVVDPSRLVERPTRNGGTYMLLDGYGQEHKDNFRGNSRDRDIYTLTTVRLTYIVGKTFHRAKFR